jgi:hypothetical protein
MTSCAPSVPRRTITKVRAARTQGPDSGCPGWVRYRSVISNGWGPVPDWATVGTAQSAHAPAINLGLPGLDDATIRDSDDTRQRDIHLFAFASKHNSITSIAHSYFGKCHYRVRR